MMDNSQGFDPEAIEIVDADYSEVEKAHYSDRVAAFVIDLIVVAALSSLCIFFALMSSGKWSGISGNIKLIVSPFCIKSFCWISITLALSYFTLTTWLFGQSIGKKVVGIKIIKLNLLGMTFFDAFVRALGLYLSVIPLGIGFLWPLFSKDLRAFHDTLAKTEVVRLRTHVPGCHDLNKIS